MRSIATPRVFLLALSFAAAAPAWAGTAAARGPAEGGSNLVTVNSIQFSQVRDQNNSNPWMQVTIDVTASSYAAGATPDAKRFVPDVTFTFTAGWGMSTGGGRPEFAAAASGSMQALALESGTRTAILFFIAPEFLKMNGLSAGTAPQYYALQITAAGQPVKIEPRTMASSNLTSESSISNFIETANAKLNQSRGAVVPVYDLPPLLYTRAIGSNTNMPTYLRGK